MQAHGRDRRAVGRGKPQHLGHDAVDAGQFTPDDLGQFGVLSFLRQHVHKGLDGHHAVFDFMRHAGRERAQAGQAVEPPEVLLKDRGGGQAVSIPRRQFPGGSHASTGRMLARNAVCGAEGNFAVQDRRGRFGRSPGSTGPAARVASSRAQFSRPAASRCSCSAASAVQAHDPFARAHHNHRATRQNIPEAETEAFSPESPPDFLPGYPVTCLEHDSRVAVQSPQALLPSWPPAPAQKSGQWVATSARRRCLKSALKEIVNLLLRVVSKNQCAPGFRPRFLAVSPGRDLFCGWHLYRVRLCYARR